VQGIAAVFTIGVGIFVGGLGYSKAPARKPLPAHARARVTRVPKTSVALRRRQRWDSDLKAHPSRGTYRRRLAVTATAYQPIDDPMEGGRWTKTERDGRAVHGVAVDPKIVPLGTRLWIPGYGHAIADDIGGAIKGHRIDLRMQSATNMRRWGVRRVQIYVLN
jgi:3D (Asp-Asp-Asp) domain-containing protein